MYKNQKVCVKAFLSTTFSLNTYIFLTFYNNIPSKYKSLFVFSVLKPKQKTKQLCFVLYRTGVASLLVFKLTGCRTHAAVVCVGLHPKGNDHRPSTVHQVAPATSSPSPSPVPWVGCQWNRRTGRSVVIPSGWMLLILRIA